MRESGKCGGYAESGNTKVLKQFTFAFFSYKQNVLLISYDEIYLRRNYNSNCKISAISYLKLNESLLTL